MESTLYWIASLPSISVAQSVTIASLLLPTGLLPTGAGAEAVSVVDGAVLAGVVTSDALGGVAAGVGLGIALGVAIGAAGVGEVIGAGGGDLSPQADKAKAHAAVNKVSLMFIGRLLREKGIMVGTNVM